MKPEFSEEFHSTHETALDGHTYDFDWQSLYSALGENDEQLSSHDFTAMSVVFKRLIQWIITADLSRPGAERIIARRALSFAWVLDPSMFDESPSLTALAARLGIHKTTLSDHTAAARRAFGVSNRGQAHGWNFKKQKTSETNTQNQQAASQPTLFVS